MDTFLLYTAIVLSVILIVPLYRVMQGPSVFDRLVGANAVATKTIVLIALMGFVFDRVDMFIDITLAYAILGFIGSLIMAKYYMAGE